MDCAGKALPVNPSLTYAGGRRFLFPGDREMIRDRSAKMALTMLRYHLMGRPMPFRRDASYRLRKCSIASATPIKTFVAVSVMNGLGMPRQAQTT